MIHNPTIVGESTKGLMKFTAERTYNALQGKIELSITISDGDWVEVKDKTGIVQYFYYIEHDGHSPGVTARSQSLAAFICVVDKKIWALYNSKNQDIGDYCSRIRIGALETL